MTQPSRLSSVLLALLLASFAGLVAARPLDDSTGSDPALQEPDTYQTALVPADTGSSAVDRAGGTGNEPTSNIASAAAGTVAPASNAKQPQLTGAESVPDKVLQWTTAQIGTPYVYGGGACDGPTGGGFDCSGLVAFSICQGAQTDLFQAQIRTAGQIYCMDTAQLRFQKVAFAQRQPGDAIFFTDRASCDCADPDNVSHTGIVDVDTASMVNAPNSSQDVKSESIVGFGTPCPHVIRFTDASGPATLDSAMALA